MQANLSIDGLNAGDGHKEQLATGDDTLPEEGVLVVPLVEPAVPAQGIGMVQHPALVVKQCRATERHNEAPEANAYSCYNGHHLIDEWDQGRGQGSGGTSRSCGWVCKAGQSRGSKKRDMPKGAGQTSCTT